MFFVFTFRDQFQNLTQILDDHFQSHSNYESLVEGNLSPNNLWLDLGLTAINLRHIVEYLQCFYSYVAVKSQSCSSYVPVCGEIFFCFKSRRFWLEYEFK